MSGLRCPWRRGWSHAQNGCGGREVREHEQVNRGGVQGQGGGVGNKRGVGVVEMFPNRWGGGGSGVLVVCEKGAAAAGVVVVSDVRGV